MQRLRAIFILIGFLGLTLPLMPLQYLLIKLNARAAARLPWHYHRLLCLLLGITVNIEGIIPTGPALLVSNHVSWMDIPILSAVTPLSFVAKREVGNWPLFGWMAKLQRSVFINRERRHSTRKSAREIMVRLKANDCLVLFAEGTSNDGNSVKPFKSSYFGVVDALDVPVIPITIVYQRNLRLPITRRNRPLFAWHGDMDLVPHLWAALQAGPLDVTVLIHPALQQASRKEMAKTAEATIRQSLALVLHGGGEIR